VNRDTSQVVVDVRGSSLGQDLRMRYNYSFQGLEGFNLAVINNSVRTFSIVFVFFVDFASGRVGLADILMDASFRIRLCNPFNLSFRNAPILIVDLPLNRKFRLTVRRRLGDAGNAVGSFDSIKIFRCIIFWWKRSVCVRKNFASRG